MARIRSVDFLPEIFQTTTNKKFLGSTLDQLIQEPKLKPTQGYIGKRTGAGVRSDDTYIVESDTTRTNYQLEPGIVFKDKNGVPVDALTYPGLIDGLEVQGARVNNHDRLFSAPTYSWSPFIDFDKFVNYSQYYWLPEGPNTVDVASSEVFLEDDFDVTQDTNANVYNISGKAGENPVLTLIRGGSYTFNVDQAGSPFYIQAQPGTSGTMDYASNVSSRDILGVTNNGAAAGTITFNVPLADAQSFYDTLVDAGNVDLASTARFNDINRKLLADIDTINDTQDLQGKTIIFLDDTPGDAVDLGWVIEPLANPLDYSNAGDFSTTTLLTNQSQRYQIFQINIVYDNSNENPIIDLLPILPVDIMSKVTIQYGPVYSNVVFFKNAYGYFEQAPLITAPLDRLYYQDANNSGMFGVIDIIEQEESGLLNIEDIIGQEQYTSPNGVVFTNGLKVTFRGDITPAQYETGEYYVEGVGTAIQLLPTKWFITPEPYTKSITDPFDSRPFDSVGYDGGLSAPLDPDYLTINRASQDRNAWTRSNRWFHIDIIKASAEYNETVAVFDDEFRAKRPIIEFKSNLQMFNHGNVAKDAVNIVDFSETDALSNVYGALGHTINGYSLITGSRVIFANDIDLSVRNKIYEVTMEDLNNDGNEVIVLTLADDAEVEENNIVLITNGFTQQGTTYVYRDETWVKAQEKTAVNQAPLFDIFDTDGNSLSDIQLYQSSTFAGTKLFSYAEGTGTNDAVLGFPLEYLNISNLGDIVFDNNLYSDTFLYVSNSVSQTGPISDGYVKKYTSATDYTMEIGWVPSAETAHVPQVFNFDYDGLALVLDVIPKQDLLVPAIKIYANSIFLTPDQYATIEIDGKTEIVLSSVVEQGAKVEVSIISDDVSAIGYYEVPSNLSQNVFNENTTQLTLGTIRNHYNHLAQNIVGLEGTINGANNTRDIGNLESFGTVIIQHAAPVALAAEFVRNTEYSFFDALKFNARYYEKFKNQLMHWVEKHDIGTMSASEILEAAVIDINASKNIDSSFYYSDMLPIGNEYEVVTNEITAISTDTFSTLNVYDFENANTNALLVYLNDELLLKDYDYVVATDGPRVTLLVDTEIGDVLTFREYTATSGSNVPNTPTKLGLFQRFKPEKFLDNTYINPTDVIVGHDGSITIAFGDMRDDVLLEFEKRIYNNIKVNENLPLVASDVIPGQFRTTDYTDEEITEMLAPDMLSWVGWNRLDYRTQDYRVDNSFTWNYSASGNKLDDRVLKGHWRGVYKFYYDTDSPHLRPWEMLGLKEEPSWWFNMYGPAPYTSGNLVLWEDLEAGIIRDPAGEYVDERFVRPGLTKIIPVDGEGNLLSPMDSIVANYSSYNFKAAWKIGDQAPVETAWRRSSSWPFAVQRLLALTKPAQYFAEMADRDRYTFNATQGQYLYDNRYRIDSRSIELATGNTPKHSYINWIIDYNKHYGYNSASKLIEQLSNLDVNLCYRMASFTDKNKLKIFTDKSSPDSTNSSLLLPDESYNLLVYRNQPFNEVVYSSVMVQKVEGGYSVFGNSNTDPYFKVMQSIPSGNFMKIQVGRTTKDATTIRIPKDFRDTVVYIPYGYVFTNKHAVVDFLASYGEYLTRVGLQFNGMEDTVSLNWTEMAKEFTYWSDQGWGTGAVINLNPAATSLEFERSQTVVDSLTRLAVTEQPLDQNTLPLNPEDYVVDRLENNFKLTPLNDKVVSYLNFKLTSFEHLLILDNTSIFNDVIYAPVNGVRQNRVKISGFTTYEWNGQLDAQGFMLNDDNIEDWDYTKAYNKGTIVKFKNVYWTALKQIIPSEIFNVDSWAKIDYDGISKGLLSNLATKSDQMLQFYNNKTANLESDADLLALGLTGFRPRDYLASLDLDDISQVNIYSDMIQKKGTSNSLEMFQNVTLNNEATDYNIFENWAIQRAQYGATASRAYVDLQLNQDLHTSNPTTVEIVNDITVDSDAAQKVALNQIYKQSVKNTSANIIPVLNEPVTDIALPYAGFVEFDDVDIYTYSFDSFDDITDNLDSIIDSTTIWVAKDTRYDWNVYRVTAVQPEVTHVQDNLDGTLTLTFNNVHSLQQSKIVVIKYLSDELNGVYPVLKVESAYKIQIEGALNEDQAVIEDTHGIVFKLDSVRVPYPSAIADTPFDKRLFSDDKIWVDNDSGLAKVYAKEQVFESINTLEAAPSSNDIDFATAVAQGRDGYGAIVGETLFNGASTENGVLYCYNKVNNNDYVFNRYLDLQHPNIFHFGKTASMAREWAAAGAEFDDGVYLETGIVVVVNRNPAFDTFTPTQIITSPDSNRTFGSGVVISQNEEWLFIGDPEYTSGSVNTGQVYAYRKIDYQDQNVAYTADGTTSQFELEGHVVVGTNNTDKPQLTVTVNNVETTDYVLNNTSVQMNVVPAAGSIVNIRRNDTQIFEGDGIEDTFELDGLYAIDGLESFTVYLGLNIQIPDIDYTYNTITNEITMTDVPALGAAITVVTGTYFRYAGPVSSGPNTFTTGSNPTGAGVAFDVSEDATQIVIGAPLAHNYPANASDNTEVGRVYLFERVVERFVVETATQDAFTTVRTIPAYANVYINGVRLEGPGFNNSPQYEVSGNTVTITGAELTVGDFVDIDIDQFNRYQTLNLENKNDNAHFGAAVSMCRSKCSVYVGAPNDSYVIPNAGSMTRYVNTSRMYGVIVGTNQNPTVAVGDTIRVNNIEVTFTNTSVEQMAADINATLVPNVVASVVDGYLVIELKNKKVNSIANRLHVSPGLTDVAFNAIGLKPYEIGQTITSPTPESGGIFGNVVEVDYNMNQVYVGAKNTTARKLVKFDNRTTTFDGRTMRVIDDFVRSGVVYSYDLLRDAEEFSAGKLVFGEQIYDYLLEDTSGFGDKITVVDNVMLVSSPGYDNPINNAGRVAIFHNDGGNLSWTAVKTQQPQTDVSMINATFIYDTDTQNVSQYLDYIDPLNGKILGVAQQNLDYIRGDDPAQYASSTEGALWGAAQVGQYWWDTSTVRFLEYYLEDVNTAAKRWGKIFPGSSVDVYEWVESNVPPAQYTGEGEPMDVEKYLSLAFVSNQRIIENKYYYWVKGIAAINNNAEKTLSSVSVASYIATPAASGVAYAAFIKPNAISLVNANKSLDEKKGILHIEYDKVKNDNNIFLEFDLIREGDPTDVLPNSSYQKLLDSFCGVDTLGNVVPDINLSLSDRYGVSFRPRQSMFKDRFAALSSYIKRVNGIIVQYPIAESKIYPLLLSEQPQPAANTGAWDEIVANNDELSYQDLTLVPTGYKYLVNADETNHGLWTIYDVLANNTLRLISVQSYDTTKFWSYIDWYTNGFNADSKPDVVVDSNAELLSLTPAEKTLAKVLLNSDGNWELHYYENAAWTRVGLQNGTIEFSAELYDYSIGRFGWDNEVFDAQYFDQEPVVETRNIIRSINEEILIGELAVERNLAFISIFKYVLSEQGSVDWLYKTSLIDVNHRVRSLAPYDVYQKENQDYVIDYINESKPYHTKIKEFRLIYDGLDQADMLVTDFDCPSYYNADFEKFISPVLDDGALLVTDSSNTLPTDAIWTQYPWNQWYDNHRLTIESVEVINQGFGYITAPQVIVTGDCIEPAELRARVDGSGQLIEVIVDYAGKGYSSTPIITFEGGNGSNATARAVVKNDLVRSFTMTLKYDRYEYTSSVQNWENTTSRAVDDLIRYADTVYKTLVANTDLTFVASKYEVVDIENLSGLDRTAGYYIPDVNKPGLDLSLLIGGLVFPGVQVDGPGFDESSGYDVGNFDVRIFDGIDIGPEGLPTYSESIIDAAYESSFTDSYLGTRPTDINVDGAEFVDVYHSHSPEELVPGSIFDTLDIQVTSRPGADYLNDGHGFAFKAQIYNVGIIPLAVDFINITPYPITVYVVNTTTNKSLYRNIDYTLDWASGTIMINNGVSLNDEVKVFVSEIGGGDQLHREIIRGNEVINSKYEIPVNAAEIDHVVAFGNGARLNNVTVTAVDQYTSEVNFSDTFSPDEFITITVFGNSTTKSESYVNTITFVAGSTNETLYNESYFNESFFSGGIVQPVNEFILPSGLLGGMNKMNAIVELNGDRLRPPEGKRHFSDGATLIYTVPNDGDIDQTLISGGEVKVYVDGVLQQSVFDYVLSDPGDLTLFNVATFGNDSFYDPDQKPARYITFLTPPPAGAVIDVFCTTAAEYSFSGDEVVLNVATIAGDVIAVTVFGDTSELNLFTEVFAGPTVVDEALIDYFDTVGYDDVPFAQDEGTTVKINVFGLDKINVTNPERLWVTLNGARLQANDDFFIIEDNRLILTLPVIADTDILAITSMTESVVANGVSFRVFKDMRDNYAAFSMSDSHVTYLVQDLEDDDDIIYVYDASVIGAPNLVRNQFGVVIIDGERIMFRERDTNTNTLSGLRRGTAGTGASFHASGSDVSDSGLDAMIPNTFSSGHTYTFLTEDWDTSTDTIYLDDAERVGVRSWGEAAFGTITIAGLEGYHVKFTQRDTELNTISGLTIVQNDTTPPYQPNPLPSIPATISASSKVYDSSRDKVWYAQGVGTASNGVPLQDQTTIPAQFIRN